MFIGFGLNGLTIPASTFALVQCGPAAAAVLLKASGNVLVGLNVLPYTGNPTARALPAGVVLFPSTAANIPMQSREGLRFIPTADFPGNSLLLTSADGLREFRGFAPMNGSGRIQYIALYNPTGGNIVVTGGVSDVSSD